MFEQLLNFLKKNYYSISGFLAGLLLIAYVLISLLDPFLEKGIKEFSIRLIIYLTIFGIWTVLWIILKNYFPKKRKDKIGIVIAIRTENEKQKLLIKNDLVEGMKKLLKENSLLDLFHLIVLQDYKAIKASKIIDDYNNKKKEFIKKKKFKDFNKAKENKIFEKLNKKINGHFYIWGTIKKRQDIQPKYFINLDALVVHRPIKLIASRKIARDFKAIMPKDISFFENFEVPGFEIASSQIFMAIRYITGIAAFVSRDIFIAFKLHNGLQREINKYEPIPPNLKFISKKLCKILFLELVIQAKFLTFPQKYGHPKKFEMPVYNIQEGLGNSKLNASYDDYKTFQYIQKYFSLRTLWCGRFQLELTLFQVSRRTTPSWRFYNNFYSCSGGCPRRLVSSPSLCFHTGFLYQNGR